MLVAGLFALWLVGVFARQVGDASSAGNQADQLRARNVAMEHDVASLELELKLIKEPAFVSQMARGYQLGSPREIPFTVDGLVQRHIIMNAARQRAQFGQAIRLAS